MSQPGDLPEVTDRESTERQSFVLRVWLEEAAQHGRRAPWRGRIIHLPTSEECYTGDLNRIRDFVARHLDRMGARLPLPRKLRLWWGDRLARGRRGRPDGADRRMA